MNPIVIKAVLAAWAICVQHTNLTGPTLYEPGFSACNQVSAAIQQYHAEKTAAKHAAEIAVIQRALRLFKDDGLNSTASTRSATECPSK